MPRKVKYQNWLTELGFDPSSGRSLAERSVGQMFVSLDDRHQKISDEQAFGNADARRRVEYIREQVSLAVSQLSDDEREFVERFYFSGETIPSMAEQSGKAIHRLEALQKRALRRLKKLLKGLVFEAYGIKSEPSGRCPICDSVHRSAIDALMASRDPERSWRPVMREIQVKFGLAIQSPMTLVGHEKYH